MTTAKRLGSTVFSDSDPFDDLRPAQKKKMFPLASVEPPAPPEAMPLTEHGPPVASEIPAQPEPEMPTLTEPLRVEPLPLAAVPERAKTKPAAVAEPEPLHAASRRVRFSANVMVALKERVENASYWLPGVTISAITEVALERELRRLEKEHNGGKPFERAGKLKYGRPRGDES
jgi:hypothetical protein